MRSASRTGRRLAPSRSASSACRIHSPGAISPFRMASRRYAAIRPVAASGDGPALAQDLDALVAQVFHGRVEVVDVEGDVVAAVIAVARLLAPLVRGGVL